MFIYWNTRLFSSIIILVLIVSILPAAVFLSPVIAGIYSLRLQKKGDLQKAALWKKVAFISSAVPVIMTIGYAAHQ